MRISDWSSDVCSSDLLRQFALAEQAQQHKQHHEHHGRADDDIHQGSTVSSMGVCATGISPSSSDTMPLLPPIRAGLIFPSIFISSRSPAFTARSDEHTSELQSLMRNSYAVFCLKKKNITDPKLQSLKQYDAQ